VLVLVDGKIVFRGVVTEVSFALLILNGIMVAINDSNFPGVGFSLSDECFVWPDGEVKAALLDVVAACRDGRRHFNGQEL